MWVSLDIIGYYALYSFNTKFWGNILLHYLSWIIEICWKISLNAGKNVRHCSKIQCLFHCIHVVFVSSRGDKRCLSVWCPFILIFVRFYAGFDFWLGGFISLWFKKMVVLSLKCLVFLRIKISYFFTMVHSFWNEYRKLLPDSEDYEYCLLKEYMRWFVLSQGFFTPLFLIVITCVFW